MKAKLTIRDLFAVMTIVALALGWCLDRSRLALEKHNLAADNRTLAEKNRGLQAVNEWLGRKSYELEMEVWNLDPPGY
jgi:hypothetical protein